ncbi:hypothetical protein TOPH_02897, partial [Tolypocladium ophioglossoides CBS 100239]
AFGFTTPHGYNNTFYPSWEVDVRPGETVILNGTVEEVHAELRRLNPDWDSQFAPNHTKRQSYDDDNTLDNYWEFGPNPKYYCGLWPPGDRDRWRPILFQAFWYLYYVKGQPVNGPGPSSCGQISCSWNTAVWWCSDAFGLDSPLPGYGVDILHWQLEVFPEKPHMNFSGTIQQIAAQINKVNPEWYATYIENVSDEASHDKRGFFQTNCGSGPNDWDEAADMIADGAQTIWNFCQDSSRTYVLGQAFAEGNWNVIVRADTDNC